MVLSARFRILRNLVTGNPIRLFFPLAILLLFQVSGWSAEQQVKPTFVKETSVQVERGGEVKIVMEAIPDYGNQILFEIQKAPLHGHLSELTPLSDHQVSVLYQHDGSRMPLSDEFLFRAQSPGRAKSPGTRAQITVIPPPPLLQIEPKEIDFGAHFLGEKSQTNLKIRNLGGMKASGRLTLPSGCTAPDGDTFSLEEGETVKIPVEFAPQEEKEYASLAESLPQYQGGSVLIKGRGISRFSVGKIDPLSCSVTNLSDQSITLSFSADPAWIIPPQTEVPPHGEKDFSFQQAEHDESSQASASSEIRLTDGYSSRTFDLPPIQSFIPLTINPVATTNLGTLALGASLPVTFTLQNRSEMEKTIQWIASSPAGGGMSKEIMLMLKGGESRELSYDWTPTLPGATKLQIRVKEGRSTTHELIWSATVTPTQPAATPESAPSPEVTQSQEADTQTPTPGRSQQVSLIAPIDGLSWKAKTSWSGRPMVELRWEAHEGDPERVKIAMQIMRMKSKAEIEKESAAEADIPFQTETLPVEISSLRHNGTEAIRGIQGLPPGWHLLELTRTAKDGTLEARSTVQVSVPNPKSWGSLLMMPIGLLTLLLLGAFLWKLRH